MISIFDKSSHIIMIQKMLVRYKKAIRILVISFGRTNLEEIKIGPIAYKIFKIIYENLVLFLNKAKDTRFIKIL